MRNLHASTLLFIDIHGPCLHEGTSKNEDLFQSLTEICLCVLNKTCTGVNIGPMGQPLKKRKENRGKLNGKNKVCMCDVCSNREKKENRKRER